MSQQNTHHLQSLSLIANHLGRRRLGGFRRGGRIIGRDFYKLPPSLHQRPVSLLDVLIRRHDVLDPQQPAQAAKPLNLEHLFGIPIE